MCRKLCKPPWARQLRFTWAWCGKVWRAILKRLRIKNVLRINRFGIWFIWNVSIVNSRQHIRETNEWQILQDFYHKSSGWRRFSYSIEMIFFFSLSHFCRSRCMPLNSGNEYKYEWERSIELRLEYKTHQDDILKEKRYQMTIWKVIEVWSREEKEREKKPADDTQTIAKAQTMVVKRERLTCVVKEQ